MANGQSAVISMKQLLEAGVHFGHQTKRWNPKMKRYIFTARNGIYIIDLQQTVKMFRAAYEAVRSMAAEGKTVLFVGTKKQAQEAVEEEARRAGTPYVNQRWLGGMLTNFTTIRKSLDRLQKLSEIGTDGTAERLPKKEVLQLEKERVKLEKTLGGIRDLRRVPEVFLGMLLVVHVVDQPDDAPLLLVRAFLPGDMAHDGLDRQGVRKETGAFHVIRKDRPCFFARRIAGHNAPILSEWDRPCDIAERRVGPTRAESYPATIGDM